jgi:hypothetical protein
MQFAFYASGIVAGLLTMAVAAIRVSSELSSVNVKLTLLHEDFRDLRMRVDRMEGRGAPTA